MEENFEKYDFFKKYNVLLDEAKEGIKGNKGSSLAINFIFWIFKLCFFFGLASLIYFVININNMNNFIIYGIVAFSLLFISLLFYGPMKVSVCKNAMNMVLNTKPSFKDCGYGFKKYGRNVGYGITLFFSYIFNLILLVVPVAFKYINSQFVGYILAENDDISVSEAFRLSKRYMQGFKKKYVKIVIHFIPKFLICIPTIYIYSLWLRPKFNSVIYCLYKDVKE